MTWTYSGDPASSAKDQVRWIIGDTIGGPPNGPVNTALQFASDEEINFALSIQPVPTYAAAAVAQAVADKFAMLVDQDIGQTSLALSQRWEHWNAMADRLRKGGAGDIPGGDGTGERTAVMFVGGLDRAGNDAIRRDNTVEQSSFRVGQDDKPGVPNSNTASPNEWDLGG